jgi:hypothetical protein
MTYVLLFILLIISSACNANGRSDVIKPDQYKIPELVFSSALEILNSFDLATARLSYSNGLKAIEEIKSKHPSVKQTAKGILSNNFDLRAGLEHEAKLGLGTLCFHMNSRPPVEASTPELKWRETLYQKCEQVVMNLLGNPDISRTQFTFELDADILAFDEKSRTLIIGDKDGLQMQTIRLNAIYPEVDSLIINSRVVNQKLWNKTRELYPSLSELTFRYQNSDSETVEIVHGGETTALTIADFFKLQPEPTRYELAQ